MGSTRSNNQVEIRPARGLEVHAFEPGCGNCCSYITRGLPSCLVMPAVPTDHNLDFIRSISAAPLVSHVLNPPGLVQFVQLDQHKRLASDFASASHAEGRWFDPSRDHKSLRS
jgi:hypothetical protein